MVKGNFAIFAAIFVALALLFAGCAGTGVPQPPYKLPDRVNNTTAVQHPNIPAAEGAGLKSFTSYDEIYSFLKAGTGGANYGYRGGMMAEGALGVKGTNTVAPSLPGAAPMQGVGDSGVSQSSDYSQTNVQVAGVDEADFVKNDGKYIYIAKNEYNNAGYSPFGSYSTGTVKIIDAYPAAGMKQVGEVSIEGSVSDIFVYGDKLVVFGSVYVPFYTPGPMPMGVMCKDCVRPSYYSSNFAFMRVYDISDRANPKLVKRMEVKGSYTDSRMIDGKVYAVFSDYAAYEYPLPLVRVDGAERQIAPTDIRYFDWPDSSYNYNIFTGTDLNDLSKEESRKVVLMGASQNLFVSADNMFVTYTTYDYYDPQWKIYNDVFSQYFDDATKARMAQIDATNMSAWRKERMKADEALAFVQGKIYNPLDFSVNSTLRDELTAKLQQEQSQSTGQYQSNENTDVHKFALDGNFTYLGEASVPGHVLNQFSMDEYNGNFRIATTSGQTWSTTNPASNNLYVLGSDMKLLGKLEGLAQGESIYSARFIGERVYLDTFQKTDPLFVIGLSDPANPVVLGKLQMPGFSDYLQPYDETHLIGIGKDAVAAEGENQNFAWYQGVKLSLYDVADVERPKEVATYNIGDRGTDSYALTDHKAFLFSQEKGLLAIPVLLAKIDPLKYPNGVQPSTYGDYVFQGEYVFNVSLDGFALRGTVSHADSADLAKSGSYYWSGSSVKRGLYMDDVLYTVSDDYVLANNLNTLVPISSVRVGNSTYGGYVY